MAGHGLFWLAIQLVLLGHGRHEFDGEIAAEKEREEGISRLHGVNSFEKGPGGVLELRSSSLQEGGAILCAIF